MKLCYINYSIDKLASNYLILVICSPFLYVVDLFVYSDSRVGWDVLCSFFACQRFRNRER